MGPEERHEQGVVEQISRRRCAAQINVECVRHGGERVEGDADRQDDVEMRRVILDTEGRHERCEVIKQELSVLEVSQHAEIRDDREQHPRVSLRLAARLYEALRGIPVDNGRHPQENDERRIPCGVEKIARHQKIDFLRGPRQRQRMQDQHAREKGHERERVENHLWSAAGVDAGRPMLPVRRSDAFRHHEGSERRRQ